MNTQQLLQESERSRQALLRILEDQNQAHKALLKSESRLRLALEASNAGVWEWDLITNNVQWSEENYRILGYEPSGLESNYGHLLNRVHPEDREKANSQVADAFERKSDLDIELRIILPDRSIRWINDRGKFTFDENGKPIKMCGILIDITERKRAEEALRESERRYQTLTEMSPVGIFRTDAGGSTTYVNPRWCKISGLSFDEALGDGWLKAVNIDDREKLIEGWKKSTRNQKESFSEYRFVRPDGNVAWVFGQAIPEKNIENQIVGYVGTIADITERKLAEEVLRESERRYRYLFENNPMPMWVYDKDSHRFLSVNDAAISHYGYSMDEFLSMTIEDIRPEIEQVRLREYFEQNHFGLTKRELWKHTTKSGEIIDVEITANDFEMEQTRGRLVLVNDVTERLRAESALRESEAKFRSLAETISCSIFIYQGERFRYTNPASEILTGYSIDELLSKKFWEIVHQDDRELIRQRGLARQRGEPVPPRYEFRIITKRGETRWVDFTASSIVFEGEPAGLGTAFDITDRKQAEEALKESEGKFRTLATSTPAGVFVFQGDRMIFVNPSAQKLVGYSEKEFKNMPFWDFVHPDFREMVRERGRARQSGQEVPSRYELKLLTKEGKELWVDFSAGVVQLQGKPAVIGTIINIDERKRAEEDRLRLARRLLDVQESERRLIARELHDELGQELTAMKITLQSAIQVSPKSKVRPHLLESIEATERTLQSVRNLSLDLRPSLLDDLGLVPALRWYLDRAVRRSGMRCTLSADIQQGTFSPALSIVCYRVIQEAVTNAIRHAHASELAVKITKEVDDLHLTITDNGDGFDVEKTREKALQGESLGILGMQERIELMGGRFNIISSLKNGTTVRAQIPTPVGNQ